MSDTTTTLREAETEIVHTHRVFCDGGAKEQGSANGHPRVFLDMGQADEVACKYCGRRFVYKA